MLEPDVVDIGVALAVPVLAIARIVLNACRTGASGRAPRRRVMSDE